ncbi:MAG TPA: metal ABC transporter ATP-binding protein [Thermoleophilaceae bacterium]
MSGGSGGVSGAGGGVSGGRFSRDSRAAAAVEVERLGVAFGGRPALAGVSFSVPAGALVGVLGPNGAGKTTLLRALLGELPHSGRAAIRGRAGYVPQHTAPHEGFPIDALGVVLMGRYPRLGWLRRPGTADRELALELLDRVGLRNHARRQFSALSGGQRQRVLVARALAQEGDVLLLDEPFTGVDAVSHDTLLSVLRQQAAAGSAVLMTTHDVGEAGRVCDRLLVLNRELVAEGPTDEVFTPETLRRAYGGQVLELDGGTVLLDEGVHHHDSPADGLAH